MASRIVRDSLLLGIGLSALAKDAIEEKVRELEKSGQISPGEAKKLASDLLGYLSETKQDVSQMVKDEVEKALKASPLATKKDLAELEAKFARYKKDMASFQMDNRSLVTLKRRLAKGGITKKEYERLRRELTG